MSAMDGLVEAQIPQLRRYVRALTGDAVRFAEERGASVFYGIDGALGYALVAEMDRGPLLQAAETVYRQVSP
jgi:anti-sigma factor RsiW